MLGVRVSSRSFERVSAVVLLVMLAVGPLVGCVTDRAYLADRAWESGQEEEALRHYEEVIEEGSRDPQVFFRAARISVNQGLFAQAERYYSQALRYGGGIEVAHALADYYIKTSNFIPAVRVYQYLLRHEENVQPIYSNIGTALMYGGKYVDAESNLMVAQQLNPRDPVPYMNLGVLYDRHIRNYPRSKRFYECYVELAPSSQDAQLVRTRLREYEEFYQVDTSRVGLNCGEVFRVGSPERIDLGQVFDLEFHDVGEAEGGIVIERLVPEERVETGGEGGGPEITTEAGGNRESAIDQAERWYLAGHYDRAFEAIGDRPWSELEFREREVVLDSLEGMGRFVEMIERLEMTMEEGPSPQVVERLLGLYRRVDAREKAERICSRFEGWPNYRSALEQCEF